MKKIICLYLFVLIYSIGALQASQTIGHQVLLRNSDGEPLSATEVSIRASILHGSVSGQEVYAETHDLTTGFDGVITYQVGKGNAVSGSFGDIDWANGPYFIKVENDSGDNDAYSINIVSQLHSVPFAYHSYSAAAYSETDPAFNAWDRSEGITVTESQIVNLGNYLVEETQTLADVIALGNEINTQVKSLSAPTEDQDATNKQYVDDIINQLLLRIEALEDALDMKKAQQQ